MLQCIVFCGGFDAKRGASKRCILLKHRHGIWRGKVVLSCLLDMRTRIEDVAARQVIGATSVTIIIRDGCIFIAIFFRQGLQAGGRQSKLL